MVCTQWRRDSYVRGVWTRDPFAATTWSLTSEPTSWGRLQLPADQIFIHMRWPSFTIPFPLQHSVYLAIPCHPLNFWGYTYKYPFRHQFLRLCFDFSSRSSSSCPYSKLPPRRPRSATKASAPEFVIRIAVVLPSRFSHPSVIDLLEPEHNSSEISVAAARTLCITCHTVPLIEPAQSV